MEVWYYGSGHWRKSEEPTTVHAAIKRPRVALVEGSNVMLSLANFDILLTAQDVRRIIKTHGGDL